MGKKLAEFLWEMHNLDFDWDKEFSIKRENEKVVKNLKYLEPCFTKDENEYLKKYVKKYDKLLLESEYVITQGDLHSENILVNDKNEMTGVIDFGNMEYMPVEPQI